MTSSKKIKQLSIVSPVDVATALKPLPPLLVGESAKRFLGLRIKAAGKILYIHDFGPHATIGFRDHGVHVSANFDKPISPELMVLNQGATVSVIGTVFNATGDIVVLDHCALEPPEVATSPTTKIVPSWDETWWGKLTIKVLGGLCVAAILALIGYLIHLWWK